MSNNNNNQDLISVWMNNMYDCKNNMHQVNPLLKFMYENNILPKDKYVILNKGLVGFNSNIDKELSYYDDLVNNTNFKPESNDEKNLVKLLANVNNKVNISKDVLQSVILSWLLTNREYTCSSKLLYDSNDLYNKLLKYGKIKYGGTGSKNQSLSQQNSDDKANTGTGPKNQSLLQQDSEDNLMSSQVDHYIHDPIKFYYVKSLNTHNPSYFVSDGNSLNKLNQYIEYKKIIEDIKHKVNTTSCIEFADEDNVNVNNLQRRNLINNNLLNNILYLKKGGSNIKFYKHIKDINFVNQLKDIYKNLNESMKHDGITIETSDNEKMNLHINNLEKTIEDYIKTYNNIIFNNLNQQLNDTYGMNYTEYNIDRNNKQKMVDLLSNIKKQYNTILSGLNSVNNQFISDNTIRELKYIINEIDKNKNRDNRNNRDNKEIIKERLEEGTSKLNLVRL